MPLGVSGVMIALLAAIAYSGIAFFTPMQLYGGIWGIILAIAAIASAKLPLRISTA